jgi:hypothetical protein
MSCNVLYACNSISARKFGKKGRKAEKQEAGMISPEEGLARAERSCRATYMPFSNSCPWVFEVVQITV